MKINVGAVVTLKKDECPTGLLSELKKELTAKDSGGNEICVVETQSGWQGEEIVLPRGCINFLAGLTRANGGLALEVQSSAYHGNALNGIELKAELRSYQKKAVAAMVRRKSGVVVAPCGAGKTVIGLGAVAALGRSALILVHTIDLVEQWKERIADLLGFKAGLIGNGKLNLKDITVATIQTLYRLDEWDMAEIATRFGTLIIDEDHHQAAKSYRKIVNLIPARYRFGLTATPERSDGLSKMLQWYIGPTIYEINQRELIDAGHLVRPRTVTVNTGITVDFQDLIDSVQAQKAAQWEEEGRSQKSIDRGLEFFDWDPDGETRIPDWLVSHVYSALAADPQRNSLIVDLAARDIADGHCMLVLANRTAHCKLLAEELASMGYAAEALTGKTTKKQRKAILDAFRTGEIDCLAATQLADEGLDIPRLDRVILAAPTRAKGRTIQRIGRLMRPAPGKSTPVLYDLVDDVGFLRNQATARKRAYRQALGPHEGQCVSWNGAGVAV